MQPVMRHRMDIIYKQLKTKQIITFSYILYYYTTLQIYIFFFYILYFL